MYFLELEKANKKICGAGRKFVPGLLFYNSICQSYSKLRVPGLPKWT
jgi:hypothetical protein